MESAFPIATAACKSTRVEDTPVLMPTHHASTQTFRWLRQAYFPPKLFAKSSAVTYPRALGHPFTEQQMLKALGMKSPDGELIRTYVPGYALLDWGYSEPGLGMTAREIFLDKQTLLRKATAQISKADQATWGKIWNAATLYVEENFPKLKVGTDEYYKKVGKITSDAITETQVIDTPFHRPPIQRSKNAFAKGLTIFMSEPLKIYNMARTGLLQKIQAKKYPNLEEGEATPSYETAKKDLLHSAVGIGVSAALVSAVSTVFEMLRGKKDLREVTAEDLAKSFGGNMLTKPSECLRTCVMCGH